jgi:hypothetical protein
MHITTGRFFALVIIGATDAQDGGLMKTVCKVKLHELCNVKNRQLGPVASICINQVLRSDLRKKIDWQKFFTSAFH